MTQAVPYRSAAARAPVTAAGHWWPVPLQETLKHWKYRLVQSLWCLWVLVCKRFCLSPPSVSGMYMGCDYKCNFTLLTIWWDFSFALRHGLSFFGGIQHCPVGGYSAVSCNFGILSREEECISFYHHFRLSFHNLWK